jgi:hypothetical protein
MRTHIAYSLFRAVRAIAAVAMLASLLTGCQIYIGDDDPNPPVCTIPPLEPPLLLLDPTTGECVAYDLGPICDPDTCVCAVPDYDLPPFAPCFSDCTGLDEYTCMAFPGCRALYRGDEYHSCFATGPGDSDLIPCEGLDAWECSFRDYCIAIHEGEVYPFLDPVPPEQQVGRFVSCQSEPTPCSDNSDCQDGERCNFEDVCGPPPPDCADDPTCDTACGGFCVPDDGGSCFGEVFCDVATPECPAGTTPGVRNGCYTGQCIPLGECPPVPYEECHGQPACDSLPPDCPEGHVPQHRNGCWTGACIPLELCEPQPSPGACFGAITCDAQPTQCKEGSVPGISNGCFDGTCIELDQCGSWPPSLSCTGDALCELLPAPCPEGYVRLIEGDCYSDICAPAVMCEAPPPVCSDIADEETCLASGCTPVYTGADCTCSPDGGCTCESWQFDRCQ